MQHRSAYKLTWNALAGDETQARMFVAGHLDNKEWNRSAGVTLGVLQKFVGIHSDDVVLEIGCGMGRVGRVLAPLCTQWIGTDISGAMLAQARIYLEGMANVELIELPTPALTPIPDASVDVVYCTVVFMHLFEWDRYRYIQEAFRVLRPGGRCYFDNIDITTDHGWGVFLDGAGLRPDQRPSHLSMVSTATELETYGKRAGFSRVKVRRWGGAWVALTGRKR